MKLLKRKSHLVSILILFTISLAGLFISIGSGLIPGEGERLSISVGSALQTLKENADLFRIKYKRAPGSWEDLQIQVNDLRWWRSTPQLPSEFKKIEGKVVEIKGGGEVRLNINGKSLSIFLTDVDVQSCKRLAQYFIYQAAFKKSLGENWYSGIAVNRQQLKLSEPLAQFDVPQEKDLFKAYTICGPEDPNIRLIMEWEGL